MHEFGGIVLDVYFGVWWMGGTALGNGDGFFCRQGEAADEEGHPYQLAWKYFA